MDELFYMYTERLSLSVLRTNDHEFIFQLVNTEEWIRFIGNRNVDSREDAIHYIEKILADPNITYWVVRLKESETPIGIITFIKRTYLQYHDIGFAFLPAFINKGYAYEATHAVLQAVVPEYQADCILATTVATNSRSIQLLTKLGFFFDKEIRNDDTVLQLYAVAVHDLTKDGRK